MMYQKIIVPIDHGNRNMKTEHKAFTSGFVEGDCRPALGEYLYYGGRYYALAEQRIPYMRDKTVDDRFFIPTLFAVAMEAEKQMLDTQDTILQAVLPVGLPPKHYGALYRKFEEYFKGRGIQQFTYKGIPYRVEITDAAAFPQDYAAAMTVYQRIAQFNKVVTVDIGGFTLDYLLIRGGRPDLGVCDSLEKGVIKLYNDVASRINSEKDILLDDTVRASAICRGGVSSCILREGRGGRPTRRILSSYRQLPAAHTGNAVSAAFIKASVSVCHHWRSSRKIWQRSKATSHMQDASSGRGRTRLP